MSHPDFLHKIVPVEYFENNIDFALMVVKKYEDEKDKAISWYGPKKPFVITMPKLIDNAYLAKRIIKKQNEMSLQLIQNEKKN